jgi:hypothetical protein
MHNFPLVVWSTGCTCPLRSRPLTGSAISVDTARQKCPLWFSARSRVQGETENNACQIIRRRTAIVLLTAAPAAAKDFLSSPLSLGVYECHDQMNNPSYTLMFGLIDENTYSNYDGLIGTYAYDPDTGVISVGLDKGAPARYVRTMDTAFRGLNEDGSLAGFTCPLNRAKDATQPPW